MIAVAVSFLELAALTSRTPWRCARFVDMTGEDTSRPSELTPRAFILVGVGTERTSEYVRAAGMGPNPDDGVGASMIGSAVGATRQRQGHA